jgi:hypothetical protein
MLNKLRLRLQALFFMSRMENELEEELQFQGRSRTQQRR